MKEGGRGGGGDGGGTRNGSLGWNGMDEGRVYDEVYICVYVPNLSYSIESPHKDEGGKT